MPHRRPVPCLAVATLLSVLAAMPAAAASTGRATAAGPDAGRKIAAAVQPHRAVYKMALKSARNSSKVSDVRGKMMFEWADACDGWTTEQRFQLRFVYVEGDEMQMTTNYTTWESKNGRRYRFNVRKLVNGEPDEEIRGDATLNKDGKGGTARFATPEQQSIPLPAGSLFPTAHTLGLLDHAQRGDQLVNRVVFDGADAEGPTEISAFIGRPAKVDDAAAGPLIKGRQSWPVRMAFFPLAGDSSQPEYEMSLRLLDNGVAQSMLIDYGDFTVGAELETIEALPKSGCDGK